jgi:hypothetical protein
MYVALSSNQHNQEHKHMYQVNIEGEATERNPEFRRQKSLHEA